MIDDVKLAAQKLQIASIWKRTGKPLDLDSDFIYELYVLFELIKKVKTKYSVVYHPGNGETENAFPKSSAEKKGRPKFIVKDKDGNELAQVCAGTRIYDISGKYRAPDISIQAPNSSEKPDYTQVCLIHDAKYRKDNGVITGPEFSQFARFIELLEVENPSNQLSDELLDALTFKELKLNSLITNGKFSTEPDSELQRKSVKEVCNFFPGHSEKTRP